MSMSALEFMHAARSGKELTPVSCPCHMMVGEQVFYFSQLTAAQEDEIVELYRRNLLALSTPFVQEPHFMRWLAR